MAIKYTVGLYNIKYSKFLTIPLFQCSHYYYHFAICVLIFCVFRVIDMLISGQSATAT